MPKCPSSTLQVSFHHGVDLRRSGVRRNRTKKNNTTAKETLSHRRASLLSPPSFKIPSFPKTLACGPRVESRPHSLLCLSRLLSGCEYASPTQRGRESHQLDLAADSVRPHQRVVSRTFPPARLSTDRTDGDGGEDRAPRGSITHTQPAPHPTHHTHARTPMVSLPTLPGCLHLAFNPPPKPTHPQPHTRAPSLRWEPLETHEAGGLCGVEPLLVEF